MAGTSGTRHYTHEDILNGVAGFQGQVADAAPMALMVMGVYQAAPTAVADGQFVPIRLNKLGQAIADRQAVSLFTTTTAGSGSFTGTAFTNIGGFRDIDVILNVTFATGLAPTLNFYLDSRLDGTNWTNLVRAADITAAGTRVIHLTKRNAGGDVDVSGDAGAGTVRAIGWSDDIRVRYAIAPTTGQFSFNAWLGGVG